MVLLAEGIGTDLVQVRAAPLLLRRRVAEDKCPLCLGVHRAGSPLALTFSPLFVVRLPLVEKTFVFPSPPLLPGLQLSLLLPLPLALCVAAPSRDLARLELKVLAFE